MMLVLCRSRMSIQCYKSSIQVTKASAWTKRCKDKEGKRTIKNLVEGGEDEPL